jgi:hypothetical protein
MYVTTSAVPKSLQSPSKSWESHRRPYLTPPNFSVLHLNKMKFITCPSELVRKVLHAIFELPMVFIVADHESQSLPKTGKLPGR